MTAQLSPQPVFQAFAPNGGFLVGGQLFTYAAGTSTPQATYIDSTQTTQNTNPVILNAFGQANVWLDQTLIYKFILQDASGNLLWTVDSITGSLGPGAVSVQQFGARGDGITNDSPAFNAALSSGAQAVYIPPTIAGYRMASGITVPTGVSLYSFAFQPSNPATGTKLIFDLSVGACVTMGGASANNGSCSIKAFSILRAAGTPPAGSIGLLNQNTYASVIEDILCVSHQIAVEFLGDRATKGIACQINRMWTGAAYDSHCVIDTFPECRFNQCRFGMNGAGDVAGNSYVRIQGGSTSNPANGPGGIFFENCQFNQGAAVGTRWLEFRNQQVGSISDIEIFSFVNCYIEDNVVGVFSDATWPNIINFFMTNCIFNPTSAAQQFLSLNAATQLSNWHISNCNIKCAFTVAPTPQINFLYIDNTEFLGLVSITAPVNSVVAMANCNFTNGLTIAGSQNSCKYDGVLSGGALTKTGLTALTYPLISIMGYDGLTSWSPALAFGGAAVGLTYSVQQGLYQISGNVVTCQFSITITAVGSSTGAATISNLPIPDYPAVAGGAGSGVASYATGMAGLTSGINLNAGSGVVSLYQNGATGISTLTNANFTNASVIKGSFSYIRA